MGCYPHRFAVGASGAARLLSPVATHPPLVSVCSVPVTVGGRLCGTLGYMAPEQASGEGAVPASDTYAAALILYEMLAGEQPYKGEQPMQIAYQHATDSVPRPSVKNPGVPEQLDELAQIGVTHTHTRTHARAHTHTSAVGTTSSLRLASESSPRPP